MAMDGDILKFRYEPYPVFLEECTAQRGFR